MKYFIGIVSLICIYAIGVFPTYSYELTDNDNEVLDIFEEELFLLIDESDRITPEKVILYIETILHENISERHTLLLEVVADDISYSYYLGTYAYDVLTKEDCYDDEYYDTVEKRCYFDDTTYKQGSEENYEYETKQSSDDQEEYSEEQFDSIYTISGNDISLSEGKDSQVGKEIWDIFISLIPQRNREDFKLYRLINDKNGDTGAYVEQDIQDNNKWNLTVNIDAFTLDGKLDTQYMYATLIHEYAHVLTLNKKQVRYIPQTNKESILVRFEENCQENMLQEGCLEQKAYMNAFINTFWSDSEELRKVREEELDVYTGNESNFVTDYAATNPGEDIAESFTYFVLRKRTNETTISNKKLNFFYSYTELENLRKAIRTGLSTLN